MKIDPIDKSKKTYYHTDEKHTGYEVRDISWITLLWIGAVIIIGLMVFVVVLDSYFTVAKEQQIYEYVLKPQSKELRELKSREQEILNAYGQLDAQKGIYRIPIDRAMQLLAEEDFKARQNK
jgi:hypothetical protein